MGGVPTYGHGLVASRHGRLALGAQLELLGVEHQLVLVVGLGNVGHNVVASSSHEDARADRVLLGAVAGRAAMT